MAAFAETFVVPHTSLLLVSGGGRILLDTGAGLRTRVEGADFRPDQIDYVVLSHGHSVTSAICWRTMARPCFPNARELMNRAEFDLCHSVDIRNRLGRGVFYGSSHDDLMSLGGPHLTPLGDRNGAGGAGSEIVCESPSFRPQAISALFSAWWFPRAPILSCTRRTHSPCWSGLLTRNGPPVSTSTGRSRRRHGARILDRAAAEHSRVYHCHFSQAALLPWQGTVFVGAALVPDR